MEKKILKNKEKVLLIFLSVNLIGIAVSLILQSGLGCDPIGLLCDGISHMFFISFGAASFLYNGLIIGIAMLVAGRNLGIGTIAYGLLSGVFIDIYQMVFSRFDLKSRGWVCVVLIFFVGEICMSLAFAILIQLKLGMTALDAVLVKLKETTHIPYAYLKICVDILLVISGTLMGGIFGVGTIISALITGILIARFAGMIEYIQTNRWRQSCKEPNMIGEYIVDEEI